MSYYSDYVYPNSIGSTLEERISVDDGKRDKKRNCELKVKQFLRFCEVFMVISALLLIIGLFTMPTVFYVIPSEKSEVI